MRSTRDRLAWLLLLLCVAEFLRQAWPPVPHLDDAYISYRYAKNLASGLGLVYNTGEYVEGFTNLLWTLLVAGGLALGMEAKPLAHGLGLAAGSLALCASFGLARTLLAPDRRWLAAVPPLLLLASISFIRWSTSGMETPLFVLAVTAALWAEAADRPGWTTFFACTATLTRPDGALLAAVVLASIAWRRREQVRRALVWPALWLAVLTLLTLFRLVYYGSPLPNTFYAKVPGTSFMGGLRYLSWFLGDGALLLIPPASWATWKDPRARPAAAFCAATALYVIAIGGDAFAHHRFLLPALAPLAALAVHGTALLWSHDRRFAWAAAVCVAATAWVQVYGLIPSLERSKRSLALGDARWLDGAIEDIAGKQLRAIRQRGGPVRLVASTGIGWFGYHSGYPMLDVLGLVDPNIARGSPAASSGGDPVPGHLRSNAEYILSRRPDYILIRDRADERETLRSPVSGSELLLPRMNAELDLYAHPVFRRDYLWVPVLIGYQRQRPGPEPTPGSAFQ